MQFITYDKLNAILKKLINGNYKNKVIKHKPLAYTPCHFPVEHFSIGHGKKHLTVMAGTHGTEIIGIDFVLKLMQAIAQGQGIYENFNSKEFTIDFIPCQNPESFITVTEALRPYAENLSETEFEKLSKEYYFNYRKDDIVYLSINAFLKEDKIIQKFWDEYRLKDITKKDIISFCKQNNLQTEKIDDLLEKLLKENIIQDIENPVISKEKFHYQMFPEINVENLKNYPLLKEKIKSIMETKYGSYTFPKTSLIDWRANSNGIDLNKNNPNNFQIKKEEYKNNNYNYLFGNLRFNSLMREVPGPQGMSSVSKKFTFENENIGLLKHLLTLQKNKEYVGTISYHGTGGVIYAKPLDYHQLKDSQKRKLLESIDKENTLFAETYQSKTDYKIMNYAEKLTGTGDMIRQMLPKFLIVELSKMGGNPLGPYGDKENYKKVINDNLIAFNEILNTLKSKTKI